MATFRRQYPAALQFAFGTPKYEKPFLVRSIWHDGQFTYIKSDAQELPALYEVKDGQPSLVNFQVAARTSCRRCSSVGISRSARTALLFNKDGRVWQTLNPSAASVTDHRIAPRGVLPRRTQTWLMVGVAVGILGIIVFTGHPEPRAGRPRPSPARHSRRIPSVCGTIKTGCAEEARQQTLSLNDPRATAISRPGSEETPAAAGTTNPLMGERRRREYESLFASNVVMSRRPDGQQLATSPGPRHRHRAAIRPAMARPTRRTSTMSRTPSCGRRRYAPGTLASTTTAPAAVAPGGASSTAGAVPE